MKPDWGRMTLVFLSVFVLAHVTLRHRHNAAPQDNSRQPDDSAANLQAAESMRDWQIETAAFYAGASRADFASVKSNARDATTDARDVWNRIEASSRQHRDKLIVAQRQHQSQHDRRRMVGPAPPQAWSSAAIIALAIAMPLSLTRHRNLSRRKPRKSNSADVANDKTSFGGDVLENVRRIDTEHPIRLTLPPEYFDLPGQTRSRFSKLLRGWLLLAGLLAAGFFWWAQVSQTTLFRL